MSNRDTHSGDCLNCDGSGFVKIDAEEWDNCPCIDGDAICVECQKLRTAMV